MMDEHTSAVTSNTAPTPPATEPTAASSQPAIKTRDDFEREQRGLKASLNSLKLQRLELLKSIEACRVRIAELNSQRGTLLLDQRDDDLAWNTTQIEEQDRLKKEFERQVGELDQQIRATA